MEAKHVVDCGIVSLQLYKEVYSGDKVSEQMEPI